MSRKRENILVLILGAVGLVFLVMMTVETVHPTIIGDETFSMKLVENSYRDIVSLTARDVHPPLYYFLLKTVVEAGSVISINPVTAGKFASVLPFLLLGFVLCTKVRKQYGKTAAALSLVCVTGMPQMMKFAVEIRMYSWGMLFLVLLWLAFCDIVTGQGNRRAYISFTVCGLFAAYTHYFSCLGAGYLYLVLFIYCLTKERGKLKYWLGCSVATVICYLPWLPVLWRQMNGVQEGYWIEEISFRTLVDYLQFLYNPAVYVYYSGTILGIITFLLVAAVTVGIPFYTKRKGDQKTDLMPKGGEKDCNISFCILAGAGQLFFVIGLGVFFSLRFKPSLVQRYLFFCMGVFWMAFAIGISRLKNEKLQIGISVFLLIVTFLNGKAFIRTEEESRTGWLELEHVLEEVGKEDVILGNFGQVRLALSYAMPDTKVCYYWRQKTEDLFLEMYGNLEDTRDEEAIFSHLTDRNRIYYFDSFQIGEFHLQEDCTEKNSVFTDMGTCLIEDIPVRIYRVERGE